LIYGDFLDESKVKPKPSHMPGAQSLPVWKLQTLFLARRKRLL